MNQRSKLRKAIEDEAGLSTVEYIIILILIAIVAIAAWRSFGAAVQQNVTEATDDISGLRSGGG